MLFDFGLLWLELPALLARYFSYRFFVLMQSVIQDFTKHDTKKIHGEKNSFVNIRRVGLNNIN